MMRKSLLLNINFTVTALCAGLIALGAPERASAFSLSDFQSPKMAAPTTNQKILGGTDVNKGEYPWVAGLLDASGNQICNGALIAPKWVLTAAHCTMPSTHVRVGSNNIYSGGQLIGISRRIPYPGYSGVLPNDIALLELATPAVGITPIPIATSAPPVGAMLRHFGWGVVDPASGTRPNNLRTVQTPVLTPARCNRYAGTDVICVQSTAKAGICTLDSGGASILNNTLVGIVSGAGDTIVNCTSDTLLTNVAHFGAWIQRRIAPGIPMTNELSGVWYNPLTDGQGFMLDVRPHESLVFGGWYTYAQRGIPDPSGPSQRWFTLHALNWVPGQTVSSVEILQNLGGNFNAPPDTESVDVGDGTLTFESCTQAHFDYDLTHDVTRRVGSIPLVRLGSAAYCQQGFTPNFSLSMSGINPSLDGAWYDPAVDGQGLQITILPDNNLVFAAWYTFDIAGFGSGGSANQRWYTISGPYVPESGLNSVSGLSILESRGGSFDSPPQVQSTVVGSASLSFSGCGSATLSYTLTPTGRPTQTGTIPLSRLSGGANCYP